MGATSEQHWPTLNFALREFLLEGQARQFTAPTIEHYRGRLGAFVRWAEQQDAFTLRDVTPSLLRAYLVYLQARGLASNTQHTHARALRAFLNFCRREGLIDESPFAKVKMPRADKVTKPALSSAEVRRLVAACSNPRDLALLLVALDTGARASELCALNIGDVNFDTLTVDIRHGKGRKDRTTFIGPRTARALSRYIGKLAPVATVEGAALFQSETQRNAGGRLTRSGIHQIVTRLGKAAGVPGVHPHRLRRTFAVTCLRGGMDLYTLARLMGHAGIDALRPYVDSIGDDLQRAHRQAAPVDKLLRR